MDRLQAAKWKEISKRSYDCAHADAFIEALRVAEHLQQRGEYELH
jgi:hypothetical protein